MSLYNDRSKQWAQNAHTRQVYKDLFDWNFGSAWRHMDIYSGYTNDIPLEDQELIKSLASALGDCGEPEVKGDLHTIVEFALKAIGVPIEDDTWGEEEDAKV